MDIELVIAGIGVEQRDIEVLTFATALAVQQRKTDRGRRMHPGRDIAHADHREGRRAVGVADHAHHPAIGLRDVIKARQGSQRSGLAERRN